MVERLVLYVRFCWIYSSTNQFYVFDFTQFFLVKNVNLPKSPKDKESYAEIEHQRLCYETLEN